MFASKQISSGKVVFIDFWATWCGPCKMISPHFEKLSDEYQNAEFYKVDVDDQDVWGLCNLLAFD